MHHVAASKKLTWCIGATWASGNSSNIQVFSCKKDSSAWFLRKRYLLTASSRSLTKARNSWGPTGTWWLSWISNSESGTFGHRLPILLSRCALIKWSCTLSKTPRFVESGFHSNPFSSLFPQSYAIGRRWVALERLWSWMPLTCPPTGYYVFLAVV